MANRSERREKRKATAKPEYGAIRNTHDLGALLREHRRSQGLTLDEFYQASGLSTRFMSMLERGKLETLDRVLAAIKILGLDIVIVPRWSKPQALSNFRRGTLPKIPEQSEKK